MHDPESMPRLLAQYLSRADGRRSASVSTYEVMVGGYSRSMARAVVEWSDGSRETFVLRGDPPAGKSMMDTDRDSEWALLRSLGDAQAIDMPAARYYDGTGEHLGTKCIVLDFVDGRSLQSHLNDLSPDTGYGNHRNDLVDTMAKVHSIDVDALPDRPVPSGRPRPCRIRSIPALCGRLARCPPAATPAAAPRAQRLPTGEHHGRRLGSAPADRLGAGSYR